MVTSHSEPSRIWPALLARHAFSQTYGMWIVGFLAVVLVTAKFHDAVMRKNRRKIKPDGQCGDMLVTEMSEASQRSIQLDVIDSSRKSPEHRDEGKMAHVEFFCTLRSKGFYLKRIKDKKTFVKCVRLNDNLELSWNKKYRFGLGSGSSELRLESLMSAFLCEGNRESRSSQFILQFPNKVLCFGAASREASVYLVNGFDDLRRRHSKDPYLYCSLNEFNKRRQAFDPSAVSLIGTFSSEDDVSVNTASTQSTYDSTMIPPKGWHNMSLHRRREAVIVQPI